MTAKDLAGAYYEEWHSERFRKLWPNAGIYIARNWTTFVPVARQKLVEMLGMKDAAVSPQLKEAIYEALMEDRRREAANPSLAISSNSAGRGPMMLRPDQPGTKEKAIFYTKD